MEYDSLAKIIERAIEKEAEAYTLYSRAAEQNTEPSIHKLFTELAAEELKHQEKLQRLDTSGPLGETAIPLSSESRTVDFLVDKPIESIDNIQDLFIFAMKQERLAQEFYLDTAKLVTDPNAQKLLVLLAEEEKKHLDRLEAVYDDKIVGKN